MPRIFSSPKIVIDGADNLFRKELIRGDAFSFNGVCRDQGTGFPLDISTWDIQCRAEFYLGSYNGSTFSDAEKTDDDPINLPVRIISGTNGTFAIDVPANLWPREIEADISDEVPAVALWIIFNRNETPDNIQQIRGTLIYRRGAP